MGAGETTCMMLLHLGQARQAREDAREVRWVRTNRRPELQPQVQTEHSGPRRLQGSSDLQKKLLFFVTELTHAWPRRRATRGSWELIWRAFLRSVVLCGESPLSACSEDLLFDSCVPKFQNADKPRCA